MSLRVCCHTSKTIFPYLIHTLFTAEADDRPEGVNVDKLYQIVKEQGTVVIADFNYKLSPLMISRRFLSEAVRLRSLEFENRRLSQDVRSYVEDVNTFRASWSRVVRRC